MLETPHVVIGAVIASKIPNPLISIPLAFASHFVLDKVPHWNPHLNTELKKFGRVTSESTLFVVFDVALSLVLGFFIASRALPNYDQALTVLVASFAAILPDIVEAPHFFLNFKNEFIKKWITFQKSFQNDTTPIPGLATQLITILAAFWWLFN